MSIVTSAVASAARYPLGYRVGPLGPRPAAPLVLYEFEGCPFCRKVREALTMLDLDAEIRPTPHGGARFRPEAIARGGKAQFPLLVDPSDDALVYESDAIIAHLYQRYGRGKPPLGLRLGPLTTATSSLASAVRLGAGSRARPSTAPAQPLALWSFELSPYSRRVRERLSELELPYLLHNLGPGSPRRPAFIARTGKMMVPYLEDANTGAAMFESKDIVRYLSDTYGR
ncbi:MAG: glutathione S-transferase N-terminal domain-containing protein [Kofleriaceae bacterium]